MFFDYRSVGAGGRDSPIGPHVAVRQSIIRSKAGLAGVFKREVLIS